MATRVLEPEFGHLEIWRSVMKNNQALRSGGLNVHFMIVTDETWLPKVLVDAGFFPSGNMVKKNQPKLWRDLDPEGERVKLSWATIRIWRVDELR